MITAFQKNQVGFLTTKQLVVRIGTGVMLGAFLSLGIPLLSSAIILPVFTPINHPLNHYEFAVKRPFFVITCDSFQEGTSR